MLRRSHKNIKKQNTSQLTCYKSHDYLFLNGPGGIFVSPLYHSLPSVVLTCFSAGGHCEEAAGQRGNLNPVIPVKTGIQYRVSSIQNLFEF
jgi:hypothetical protein